MKRQHAADLIDLLAKANKHLDEALTVAEKLEDTSERESLRRTIMKSIADIAAYAVVPIIQLYPDLDPYADSHDVEPDPPLTPQQLNCVASLTEDQIAGIDKALLANCNNNWRKVAAVVGFTMTNEVMDQFEGVPDLFFAKRVRDFVERGLLEASGNLDYMRYSEVRLRQGENPKA